MTKLIIVIKYDCPFNFVYFYFLVFIYVVEIYFYFVHGFLVFTIALILLSAITFLGVGTTRRYFRLTTMIVGRDKTINLIINPLFNSTNITTKPTLYPLLYFRRTILFQDMGFIDRYLSIYSLASGGSNLKRHPI
jgi:hypothetical protein